MPWQPSGEFLRINTDFSGNNVWQQDQSATIKIIASRHDTHDEDLALGIAATLNLDGFNAMRADLQMGGFKIIDLADGTVATDGATTGQVDSVQTNVDNNQTQIALNDARITALEGTGQPDPFVVENFRSNGSIRHYGKNQGSGNISINVNVATRFFANNEGAMTVTINGEPFEDDPDLGTIYQVESQIIFHNGAIPGAITLAGITPDRTIGTPNINPNESCVLTLLLRWHNGTAVSTVVWSG